MGLNSTGSRWVARQGDLILFQDGSGFILAFFERFIDGETILVSWGDCNRIVRYGDYLIARRDGSKTELGKYIGHRFENIDQVTSSLASLGKKAINQIKVT